MDLKFKEKNLPFFNIFGLNSNNYFIKKSFGFSDLYMLTVFKESKTMLVYMTQNHFAEGTLRRI